MEVSIEEITAEGWISDIKGEPVQSYSTSNGIGGVKLPGNNMRSGDMIVYLPTLLGYIMDKLGMPPGQMKEGIHYAPIGTIPYRPTPDDLFGSKEERVRPLRNGNGKMHKQAPLSVRH